MESCARRFVTDVKPDTTRKAAQPFLILRALALVLTSLVFTVTLSAQETKRTFDVPFGEAEQTLKQFATQAQREIVFSPDNVAGLKTNPVQGEFVPGAALDLMLSDTGLIATQDTKTGAFAVRKGPLPNGPRAVAKESDRPERNSRVREDGIVELDKFEVLGGKSLNMDIRRTKDDAQPYVTFDRETLTRSGATSIEDFLRNRLTMNSQNGLLNEGPGTGGFINAPSGNINLRGLGSNQTLILIDGRRAPASATATGLSVQPDITGIPLSAVERIEVLPTSASGIYGGSATGGVINVILRRDYAGAEIRTTYENTFNTDAAIRRVDLSAGFNLEGGKTSIFLTLSHSDSNELLAQDRDFLADYRMRILANNGGNYDALLSGTTPPLGATANIRSSNGTNLTLKNGTPLNSSRTFVPAGYAGVLGDAGAGLVANAGKFNLAWGPSNQATTAGAGGALLFKRPETLSASLTARRILVPWLEAYVSGGYNMTTGPLPGR